MRALHEEEIVGLLAAFAWLAFMVGILVGFEIGLLI